MGLHNPLAAPVSAFEHERQVPVHALSQQIPPTHAPCTHSLFAMHAEPSIFLAAQVIAGAQYPPAQSWSPAQVVAHPDAAVQVNPLQS